MQQSEKKKLYLLVALLGVIGIIWSYRLISGGGQEPAGSSSPKAAKRMAAEPPRQPATVELERLGRERPAYETGRNIFSPTYIEPVITPPAAGGKPGVTVTVAPPPPPPPPKDTDGDGVPDNTDKCQDTPPGVVVDIFGCRPEETAARVATEEMKKFKFIGFLKRSGRTNVFLSLNSSYYTAAKGEDIYKGYYLKDIGGNFLVFADRETRAEYKLVVNFEDTGKSGSSVPSPGASGGQAKPQPPVRPSPQPRTGRGQQYGRPGAAGGFPQPQDADEADDEEDEDDEEYDNGDTVNSGATGSGVVSPPPGTGTGAPPPPLKSRSTW